MEEKSDYIILDGKIIPADKPVLPVQSRGLMYGEGVFETFRIYSGKAFLLSRHLNRLSEGLQVLGITIPTEISLMNIRFLIHELLEKEEINSEDAICRLQVWQGGQRGYLPESDPQTHFSIAASACPKTFKSPALTTVKTKRIPAISLPSAYKFSNGINYILAAKEAAKKNADDALMQTVDGHISETTIANIFWVKGDKIFTPSKKCDLIPGITRQVVINLIQKSKQWNLVQGEFSIHDILEADAAFLCNSAREIVSVKAINNQPLDVKNNVINELSGHFLKFRNDHLRGL